MERINARLQPFLPLTQETFAIVVKIAIIIFATVAIFSQDLAIVFNDALQNELTSYTLAIPLLLIYIIYRKRKMLRAAIPFATSNPIKKPTYITEVIGALLCLLAFLLFWHGSSTFTPLEYHLISLPLFVAGLILIIFNTKTLILLAFPIAFFVFLTPPPLQIVSEIGSILSTFASEAAYNILKALGLPVTLATQYEAPLIILNKPESQPFTFAIEIACSGIYSLIGFTIFAVFVAYIARETAWKKATVFLTGFPLIYALNIFRIIIIVLIGYEYGTEAATQVFHLLGGWVLIFLGTLILLFLSEKIWKIQIFATNTKAMPCLSCNPNTRNEESFCSTCGRILKHVDINFSKLDLAKIVVLFISLILVLNLQVPVFALTEGPGQVLLQSPGSEHAATAQIFPQILDHDLQFIYRDKKFEETALQDAALVYAYTPLNEYGRMIWVALEVGSSRSTWHSWESSVIIWPQKLGNPPRATQLDLRDVQLLQNPPIVGRFFAFQQTNSSMAQVVLYWYENALFKTGETTEQKYVKISLIAYTDNPENIYQLEEELLPFGTAIVNHWQPIKTWSQIALIISKNADKLITIPITLIFGVFLLYALQRRKEKKANNNAYKKLSKINRQLIDAVHQAAKTTTPTLNNITITYKNMTEKTIRKETLRQRLIEVEKTGIIKRDIVSRQDEPIQVWKTDITFASKNLYPKIVKQLNVILFSIQRKLGHDALRNAKNVLLRRLLHRASKQDSLNTE